MIREKKEKLKLSYFLWILGFAIIVVFIISKYNVKSVTNDLNNFTSNFISEDKPVNTIISGIGGNKITFISSRIEFKASNSNTSLNHLQKRTSTTYSVSNNSRTVVNANNIQLMPNMTSEQSETYSTQNNNRASNLNIPNLGSNINKMSQKSLLNRSKNTDEQASQTIKLGSVIDLNDNDLFASEVILDKQQSGIDPGGDPDPDPIPVGDGWGFLFILALAYVGWLEYSHISKSRV